MKTFILFIISLFLSTSIVQAQDEFIDVKGTKMHVEKLGLEARVPGEPVIILESPSLGTTKDWDSIFIKAAEIAPVIRYDRSGLGQSEWNGEKPSPKNIAENLKNMLETMEVEPPYILVGHSWGTQLVRRFANLYPEMTGGLILVDPGFRPNTMKAGLKDIGFPPEQGLQEYIDELLNAPQNFPMFTGEEHHHLIAMGEWFASPILPPTPQVPVAALLGGKHGPGPPQTEQWSFDFDRWNRALFRHEMKRLIDWTLDSPDGIFILADQSGHFIQHDEPELVLSAIRYVVNKSVP